MDVLRGLADQVRSSEIELFGRQESPWYTYECPEGLRR
ncbi:Hypothetical protein A7982_00063 [Minicystis rosea]|nr:Hypothetical protein A7982_00063 [Minicystis rosea]